MSRRAIALWGSVWLLGLALGPMVGMIWDQLGYPSGADLATNLIAVAAALMTLAWGAMLGRVLRWDVILVSIPGGAVVLTALEEISLRLAYRGDPPGAIVELLFHLVVLGVLLGLGGLLGVGVRWLGARFTR